MVFFILVSIIFGQQLQNDSMYDCGDFCVLCTVGGGDFQLSLLSIMQAAETMTS